MPDNGSQPGYMRSDTHLGNPTVWSAQTPDQSEPAASVDLIVPAPASSQRVEQLPPGEQTAARTARSTGKGSAPTPSTANR